ncbi:recombinase RecX [Roseibium aquae]|uniref:Regulatory protein RecX n=1 Tax=Roseibium aquae TaxID=1323746 RepID=A0A916WZ89_9HYPH|nr:RecX family transcriptional regulator [Roseibium aquae]GGB44737.1 recombinase RecX [Roseibium aquae]
METRIRQKLLNAGFHYLNRYGSSVENLRSVLWRKARRWARQGKLPDQGPAHDPADERPDGAVAARLREDVDAVVTRCIELGLVDDEKYAQSKAFGLRQRGGSARRIRAALANKGVDPDLAETVIADTPDTETDAARTFARRRRLGPWRPDAQRAEKRDRDVAALCRAGFQVSLAISVIDSRTGDEIEDGR